MTNVHAEATKRLQQARFQFVVSRDPGIVFFATVAFQLPFHLDDRVDRACTDGTSIRWNPDFVCKMTPPELFFILAHEVCHVVFLHHVRRGGRCPKRYNIACDLAVNSMLTDAKMTLPNWVYLPGRGAYSKAPKGLAAEQYYEMVPPQPPEDDAALCGGVTEPGDGSPAALGEAEGAALVMINQAMEAAKSVGTLSADLARLGSASLNKPADWRYLLRRFLTRHNRDDYSWSRPNRRLMSRGLYLPGLYSEDLGEVLVMVDTSGSIGQHELSVFGGEIAAILAAYKCRITVVYHDVAVQGSETFESGDPLFKLAAKGGGGTSHVPVFKWAAERDEEPPVCIVALTDGYSYFDIPEPDVPVLWAITGDYQPKVPFGELINVAT